MVLRMPGKAFPEKCAWAARINRDNVIAVTSGVNPKCTSSKGLKGSDKSIFDPMNQMVCVGTAGERELFFVGGIMLRIYQRRLNFKKRNRTVFICKAGWGNFRI